MVNPNNPNTIKKEEHKKRFIAELANEEVMGNVSVAAKRLGFDRTQCYQWKKEDPIFAKEWNTIVSDLEEQLNDEAEDYLRKAIREGNITAIIFRLKVRKPKKWGVKVQHVGEGGGPIKVKDVTEYPKIEALFQKYADKYLNKKDKEDDNVGAGIDGSEGDI